MTADRAVLRLLPGMLAEFGGPFSLAHIARRAGWSRFHVLRAFHRVIGETYAAVERWIEAQGARAIGAPWESYVTDPADHPDPADWRTEVYWPLRAESQGTP